MKFCFRSCIKNRKKIKINFKLGNNILNYAMLFRVKLSLLYYYCGSFLLLLFIDYLYIKCSFEINFKICWLNRYNKTRRITLLSSAAANLMLYR